jgi:hypothetical protein
MAVQLTTRREEIYQIYPEQDFGFSSEWHFFAVNHGNRQADGTGGTVERLAAKTSPQRVYNNKISNTS